MALPNPEARHLRLQEYVALYGPIVLLFDDVHHLDSASWRLLAAAAGALAGRALFVLGLRPLPEPALPGGRACAEHVAANRVHDLIQVGRQSHHLGFWDP